MTYTEYPANAATMEAPLPHFPPRHAGFPPAGRAFAPPLWGNGFPPPGQGMPMSPYGQRPSEVNTLATLSVVFAFVFAPVGIALGHLALSQIRFRGQAGRDRALVGLTVSYAVSLAAALVLIIVAATPSHTNSASATPSTTTTTTTTPSTTARPSPRESTTEAPPPPVTTGTVRVDDLNIGDCVRLEKEGPDPTHPGLDFIKIYSSACVAGDSVYRVDQLASRAEACPNTFLVNPSETRFVCVSKLDGA